MVEAPRILIVEDESTVAHMIEMCLRQSGFRFLRAADGAEGIDIALREQPDLIVLDLMLPKVDGLGVCQSLRAMHFEAPILMLTTRAMVEERVKGLNAGADDYLAKPFAPAELIARINALLRRRVRAARPTKITLGQVRIDLARRTAMRGAELLALTKTEFEIIELLAREAGRPVSRERMLDIIWGYDRSPTTRTIDTHVWRLRKKLGDDQDPPQWLKPVHGEGYCLDWKAELEAGD